jgi:hypothetical protein
MVMSVLKVGLLTKVPLMVEPATRFNALPERRPNTTTSPLLADTTTSLISTLSIQIAKALAVGATVN